MLKFVFLLLYFFCITFGTEAYRILAVFPTPSISHQVVFRALTQELAKRGHEVVVVTPDPAFPKGQTPANLTEIDVHDLSYKLWRDNVIASTSGKEDSTHKQLSIMLDMLVEITKQQLLTDEVQYLVKHKNSHFDLLILEACAKPAFAYTHIFKVPVIIISSFFDIPGNYELVGAPTFPPLLYPSMINQRLYNLTLWEKVKELYGRYLTERVYLEYEYKANDMLKEFFGPDAPTYRDLGNNVDMFFLNTHPIWEGNRPAPPSVVYMGGVHQKPIKELPKDLKSYLDSSVNGVIYVSFGTNVSPSLFPPETIQAMVNVFSRLPYNILWKWDDDVLPGQTKNIKISKWFPQPDVLAHPKIKLFITQGGLQSTDEAITAGVPLIGIPKMADQWYNAEKYVHHKIGLIYFMETLTEESFAKAINTVIDDKSYRENVAKLRTLINDQPQRPLERAVWWTEHLLRHGGARHLRAPAANMSWRTYLEFDLILILLTCLLTITLVFSVAVYFLLKFVKYHTLSGAKLKSS